MIERGATSLTFYLLLLMGPILALSVRSFATLLIFAGLSACVALAIQRPLNSRKAKPFALLVLAFGYILLSALWGVSERASDTTGRLFLVLIFTTAIIVLFNTLAVEEKIKWARALTYSLAGGIVALLFIGPYNVYWPGLADLLAGMFRLIHHVNAALSILPIFLFLLAIGVRRQRRHIILALVGVTFIVTFVSESQTSFLATCLGIAAMAIASYSPKLCRHVIFVSLALCTLLAPLLFTASYENSWVKKYAPDIVVERGAGEIREWIYYVYANEAMQKPIFGHGINGTKNFAPDNHAHYVELTRENPPVLKFAMTTLRNNTIASHAHNLFLQIIFEFGYLGALLILAAIWDLFRHLEETLPKDAAIWAWGGVGATLGAHMFGFTLWHSWLMTASACIFIVAHLCYHLMPEADETQTH